MQKSNWLRIGLVGFATIVGGATALVACGGDDDDDVNGDADSGTSSSSSGASGNTSSGGASSSSGGSSGTSSSSSGGPAPIPAALAVIHGFEALGPIRICYAISPTAAPEPGVGISALAPLPAGAGLIPGSGGILPSTGLALSGYNIRPYLIKSSKITSAAAQCPELIGEAATVTPALVEGTDYFTLGVIEKGALEDDSTYVLVAKEDTANVGKPTTSLFKLDTETVVPADKIGVQFIHASSYLTALGSNVAPFFDRAASAGADAGAPDGGDAGTVAPPAGRVFEYFAGADSTERTAPFAPISDTHITDPFDVANTGAGIVVGPITALNRQSDTTLIPISSWSTLSDPPPAPKQLDQAGASLYFQPGRAFTFIAVGNPGSLETTPPVSTYAKPHYLVFPNRPVVPGL